MNKNYESGVLSEVVQQGDLEKINRFSRRALAEQDVYIFRLVLCDNEVDRDYEQFSVPALHQLAQLFLGKSGIFDHEMKTANQHARIFHARAEAVQGQTNSLGEPYYRLYAKAYIPKTKKNADLIEEIETGIKKEVSISCRMEKSTCSVCGKDKSDGCGHLPGKKYAGATCYYRLDAPRDAYEWSFVAVPAQPAAGVMKAYRKKEVADVEKTLQMLKYANSEIRLSGDTARALSNYIGALAAQAEFGKAYRVQLQADIAKMSAVLMPEMGVDFANGICSKMDAEELQAFYKMLRTKAKKIMPLEVQLQPEHNGRVSAVQDSVFQI